MNRTRDYHIRMRKKKIRERKNKIRNLCRFYSDEYENICSNKKIQRALSGETGGLLAKHDYGAITGGVPVKTKTKKASATYRHKCGYGPAKRYSRHDKVQITYMNQELKDYYDNRD